MCLVLQGEYVAKHVMKSNFSTFQLQAATKTARCLSLFQLIGQQLKRRCRKSNKDFLWEHVFQPLQSMAIASICLKKTHDTTLALKDVQAQRHNTTNKGAPGRGKNATQQGGGIEPPEELDNVWGNTNTGKATKGKGKKGKDKAGKGGKPQITGGGAGKTQQQQQQKGWNTKNHLGKWELSDNDNKFLALVISKETQNMNLAQRQELLWNKCQKEYSFQSRTFFRQDNICLNCWLSRGAVSRHSLNDCQYVYKNNCVLLCQNPKCVGSDNPTHWKDQCQN